MSLVALLDILRLPTLFGRKLQVEREFKYLGLSLDDKLTCNHLTHTVCQTDHTEDGKASGWKLVGAYPANDVH